MGIFSRNQRGADLYCLVLRYSVRPKVGGRGFRCIQMIHHDIAVLVFPVALQPTDLYGSPEVSGRECAFISSHGWLAGTIYRAGKAGAQATAQSERIKA